VHFIFDFSVKKHYIGFMKPNDARKLSPKTQEALRLRAVEAVTNGLTVIEAARVFGVSRTSIYNWQARADKGGAKALKARKRGRKSGTQLKPWQAALTVRTIIGGCPDQVKLPWALWTREAVGQYIENHFGVKLSRWTVGRYLKRWNLSPQKPAKRALEQNPAAVRRWLETDYPAIRAAAQEDQADIHWGDECGFRSDHQTGTTWGRKGQTPVVVKTGKRFSVNMISTITNRGKLRFMIYDGKFTADVFISFLRRLLRTVRRKIYLIVDNLSVHKCRQVADWVSDHSDRLQLFYLPPYSPELNPDEYLNNDVKSAAVGRKRPVSKAEMTAEIRSRLWSRQRRPKVVSGYFQAPKVRYAVA